MVTVRTSNKFECGRLKVAVRTSKGSSKVENESWKVPFSLSGCEVVRYKLRTSSPGRGKQASSLRFTASLLVGQIFKRNLFAGRPPWRGLEWHREELVERHHESTSPNSFLVVLSESFYQKVSSISTALLSPSEGCWNCWNCRNLITSIRGEQERTRWCTRRLAVLRVTPPFERAASKEPHTPNSLKFMA